jgi:hypothetical protein
MTPIRAALAGLVLATASLAAAAARAEAPGYVDGAMFRALIDEDQEVVEVNLEGAILDALSKQKGEDDDPEASDLFGKLKSIHAVIGHVKGPATAALTLVQQTDQKLVAKGWQRITRIKDDSTVLSVLTHTSAGRVDGLVALIFDADDGQLIFANLAGEIDITRLGEIGDRLNVPGLGDVPGLR